MKKILLLLVIFSLAFSLAACRQSAEDKLQQEIYGVKETGNVIDISDKNGQTITTTPGDVLYLKLTGEAESNNQWNVVAPVAGNFLMLKDHKVTGLIDKKVLEGKFTDEWWLKIENKGTFEIQFNYGEVGKDAENSFKLQVVSQ